MIDSLRWIEFVQGRIERFGAGRTADSAAMRMPRRSAGFVHGLATPSTAKRVERSHAKKRSAALSDVAAMVDIET
jgi:hypothetical protein